MRCSRLGSSSKSLPLPHSADLVHQTRQTQKETERCHRNRHQADRKPERKGLMSPSNGRPRGRLVTFFVMEAKGVLLLFVAATLWHFVFTPPSFMKPDVRPSAPGSFTGPQPFVARSTHKRPCACESGVLTGTSERLGSGALGCAAVPSPNHGRRPRPGIPQRRHPLFAGCCCWG